MWNEIYYFEESLRTLTDFEAFTICIHGFPDPKKSTASFEK